MILFAQCIHGKSFISSLPFGNNYITYKFVLGVLIVLLIIISNQEVLILVIMEFCYLCVIVVISATGPKT